MATLKPYKCDSCDLNAIVAGGKSAVMLGDTSTFYCQSCKTLFDQVDFDILLPNEVKCDIKCHNCGSDDVVRWSKGQPCPSCGGNLDLDPDNQTEVLAD